MATLFAGLFVIVLLAVLLATGLVLLARRRRLQFSLRTLLLGVSLVAVTLSAVLSWKYLNTARITWLDPASSKAARFAPEAVIEEKDGSCVATFTPRCRDMQELIAMMDKAQLPTASQAGWSLGDDGQQIQFKSSEREPLEARLSFLKTNDVLTPGRFVIRGRVEDSQGLPVPGARICLFPVSPGGSRSRNDGTFLMRFPLNSPAGRDYWLEVRYGHDEHRMNTQRFRLDAAHPEMVVVIRVK